jgi:hypothetical protein
MTKAVFVSYNSSEATPRAAKVLSLVIEGLSDEEIAARLLMPPDIVGVYRDHFDSVGDLHSMKVWRGKYLGSTDHVQQFDFGALENSQKAQKRERIFRPPGLPLWRVAKFLCTNKTYDSIFSPLLADFHHEYFEALKAGRKWKARWLLVLYCGAFFKSAGLNVSMRFLREAWVRFHKA